MFNSEGRSAHQAHTNIPHPPPTHIQKWCRERLLIWWPELSGLPDSRPPDSRPPLQRMQIWVPIWWLEFSRPPLQNVQIKVSIWCSERSGPPDSRPPDTSVQRLSRVCNRCQKLKHKDQYTDRTAKRAENATTAVAAEDSKVKIMAELFSLILLVGLTTRGTAPNVKSRCRRQKY